MADWTAHDLYTPTQNRDMASAHASALRGRVDRKAVGVSMFVFYASIIALGIFIFSNMGDRSDPVTVAGSEVTAGEPETGWGASRAQRAARADELDQLAQAQMADDAGQMAFFESEEDNPYGVDTFSFGDPLNEWFSDDEGGWGIPWMPSSGGAEAADDTAAE